MNIIQKILSKTLPNISRKDALTTYFSGLGGIYLGDSALPAPSHHNYSPYVEAYGDKAWVYTCVNAIAETTSSTDFVLKDAEGQIISSHPCLNLLYRPNQFMSGRALRQWIIASLELTGNAYILKDAQRADGAPGELFPLLSQLVEIVPGKKSSVPVEGYKYRAGAQTAYYRAQDIIHFKYFNPFDFFYGLSPLAAARRAVESLDKAEVYNRAFFDNAGTLSGILQTDARLDDAARSRIMKSWNEKYQSAAKAHKVALLEGGLKWQSTALSQKDMDFISGMKLNRETILSIFHVPPALAGVFDHAPQFNTKEQQRIFYQTCVLPKLTLMLEVFTEFLLPHFDQTHTLYFDKDVSGISVLKEDETARAQAAKIYYDMGFSKTEIAQALGLPFGANAAGAGGPSARGRSQKRSAEKTI